MDMVDITSCFSCHLSHTSVFPRLKNAVVLHAYTGDMMNPEKATPAGILDPNVKVVGTV